MPGLRDCIAPQQNSAEADPATEVDGLVYENVGLLLRGAVALRLTSRAVRRCWPARSRADVDTATVIGESIRACTASVWARVPSASRIATSKNSGNARPRRAASLVDGVHQVHNVGPRKRRQKSRAVWAQGCAGAEGIEIDLVVASQFDVLDPLAADQDVERDVQDVSDSW